MFKFKTFNNSKSNNSSNNQQTDVAPSTATTTTTSNKMDVDDSYKPVSDPNLSAHGRFQLELKNCPDGQTNNNSNNEKDVPVIDFDNFGKQYLASCGVKSGQALQEGGRSQQYIPRSIGGFASSEKAKHDVSKLEIGHRIIMLSPAEQRKLLQQQNQQAGGGVPVPQQQSSSTSTTADAASTNAPTIKISELVAEDDDDNNDDDDANSSDPRKSVIGENGGTILKLDPKNIQVEICGNGKVSTIQKIFVRGVTAGEEKEIDRIRQYRISISGKGNDNNNNNNNNNSKPFNFGGPFIPNNSANVNNNNTSTTASFKLFDGMIVTKKKSSDNNNNNNTQSSSGYEEECDDDDVQFLTVTKVFDNGVKGTVTSGDTLMAFELELVAPIRPRSNAIVVRESTATSIDHVQDFPIGCLVSCEKILPTTVEIRNIANGKVGTIEKTCLCSTARSR